MIQEGGDNRLEHSLLNTSAHAGWKKEQEQKQKQKQKQEHDQYRTHNGEQPKRRVGQKSKVGRILDSRVGQKSEVERILGARVGPFWSKLGG